MLLVGSIRLAQLVMNSTDVLPRRWVSSTGSGGAPWGVGLRSPELAPPSASLQHYTAPTRLAQTLQEESQSNKKEHAKSKYKLLRRQQHIILIQRAHHTIQDEGPIKNYHWFLVLLLPLLLQKTGKMKGEWRRGARKEGRKEERAKQSLLSTTKTFSFIGLGHWTGVLWCCFDFMFAQTCSRKPLCSLTLPPFCFLGARSHLHAHNCALNTVRWTQCIEHCALNTVHWMSTVSALQPQEATDCPCQKRWLHEETTTTEKYPHSTCEHSMKRAGLAETPSEAVRGDSCT